MGWDSIDNHASYSASSASFGISGGYKSDNAPGQQFAGGALPTFVNMSGSASGTTRSAVADGTIAVRDAQHQTQDVTGLSRDTENANGHIDKIFDKEKVNNQMAFAQGVQQLAGNVVGDVKAWKLDAAAKETSERLLKEHPDYASLTQTQLSAIVQSDPGYKAAAAQWSTGGTYSMAMTAVAGALGGLSASNLGAAAGGAMAPYLANAIKKATTNYDAQGNPHTDVLANTMAHAVAGAVLAQIAGGSAAAGAAGAAGGELAAKAIVKVMYPNTDIRDLTESQKQTVSALSQMAAGLAGGIASDSALGGGTGAGASKDAVENNLFGGTEDGQVNFAQEHGKNIMSCSTDPASASCQKGLAMQNALMVALPAGLGGGLLAAATPEIATAARVALQTCKGAFAICLNNIGIQVSETVVPGGVGAGGAIGIGKTVAEATTAKAEAVAANVAKVNQLQTSTVFDAIKGTQPVYPGSVIPKSFEMTLPNGQKVWVHGNATEHMAEYAASKAVNYTPEAVRLASQTELKSFQAALNTASKNGMTYGRMEVDGWQLEIKPPREAGELPTIIHARYLGLH